jgi:hypothetical protein
MATETEIREWFESRIPAEWTGPAKDKDNQAKGQKGGSAGAGRAPKPSISVDDDEILVIVPVAADRDVYTFREETRPARMEIASEAEGRFERKVSWGVRTGEEERMFTTLSVPAMTRLRFREREILDTLVAGGVARSRSEALAWCVRLVGTHEEDWLKDLKDALGHVAKARAEGPVAV